MKKRPGFAIIPLIVAIVVVTSFGIMAYLAYQNSHASDFVDNPAFPPIKHVARNVNAASDKSVTVSTADWKTYTNNQYGYSVRYPDNGCLLYDGCVDGSTLAQIAPGISVFVADAEGEKTIEDWVSKRSYFSVPAVQQSVGFLGNQKGLRYVLPTGKASLSVYGPGEGPDDPGFPKSAGRGWTITPGSEGVLVFRDAVVYGLIFIAETPSQDHSQYSAILSTFTFTK